MREFELQGSGYMVMRMAKKPEWFAKVLHLTVNQEVGRWKTGNIHGSTLQW